MKAYLQESIFGRSLLRLPSIVFIVALALVGTVLLSSCGAFGGDSGLSSDVPVDSPKRANPGQLRDNTPQVRISEQPGTLVAGDWNRAVLDYSNAQQGYVCAQSFIENTKVKVLVNAPDGNRYQYTIPATGIYINIPLSRGDGLYEIGMYENLYDDQYVALFSQSVNVALVDEFAPFLYSSTYVNFAPGDEAVVLSQQVTENATSEIEALEQIYLYVIKNYTYDYDKAATVAPGYLPNNSNTIRTQDGICFDYAALTAAMLRAQRLPTRLEIGYCGSAYHAWISVYTTERGWIRKKIELPGGAYVLLDPTFDAASKGGRNIGSLVGDGTNYQPIYYY